MDDDSNKAPARKRRRRMVQQPPLSVNEYADALTETDDAFAAVASAIDAGRRAAEHAAIEQWMQANNLPLQSDPAHCDMTCQKSAVHAFGDVFVCRRHARSHVCKGSTLSNHPVVIHDREGAVCMFSGRCLSVDIVAGPNEGNYDLPKHNQVSIGDDDAGDEHQFELEAADQSVNTEDDVLGLSKGLPAEGSPEKRRRVQHRRSSDPDIYEIARKHITNLFNVASRRNCMEISEKKTRNDAVALDKSYLKQQKTRGFAPIRQQREMVLIAAYQRRRRPEVLAVPSQFVEDTVLRVYKAWQVLVIENAILREEYNNSNMQANKLNFVFGVLHYMRAERGLSFYNVQIIRHEPDICNYLPEPEDLTQFGYRQAIQSQGWKLVQDAAHKQIVAVAFGMQPRGQRVNNPTTLATAAAHISQAIYEGSGSVASLLPSSMINRIIAMGQMRDDYAPGRVGVEYVKLGRREERKK